MRPESEHNTNEREIKNSPEAKIPQPQASISPTMPPVTERYNATAREPVWQNFWEQKGIFNFNPDSAAPLFTIDTPPPTVSGKLHLGHIFSYSQAEVVSRFMRMDGHNVRYPLGFDDNGLPTERLVEKETGVSAKSVSREEFVRLCQQVSEDFRGSFKELWKSFGLSVDWNLAYSTVSLDTQVQVQDVFRELWKEGVLYRRSAPTLYCPCCSTAIAQAEVEYKDKSTVFYELKFQSADGKDVGIATTRPELLQGCVAVFANPDDSRYTDLHNKSLITPLGDSVPVLIDKRAKIDKGTGLVMCCTYGDETDLAWVREHKLPERNVISLSGEITLPDTVGGGSVVIAQARKTIVAHLRSKEMVLNETPIEHRIGLHERCGLPIEIINTQQYFARIVQNKEKILDLGKQIVWRPGHMYKRFENWVSSLQWDWCISRDRVFGIPIPIADCLDCGTTQLLESKGKAVDPLVLNSGQDVCRCNSCQSTNLSGEKQVLDTWFTSSLTPLLNSAHPANGRLTGELYPSSMRPHAHDIIRTWTTYSIAMASMLNRKPPFKSLMISGHILAQQGEKVSKKTGGGKQEPAALVREHSADALRYAMCGATLGKDAFFDEQEVLNAKRFVTKVFNAGKFVLSKLIDVTDIPAKNDPSLLPLDRWCIEASAEAAEKMRVTLQNYEFSAARKILEEFFWSGFCDYYLEFVKGRTNLKEGHQISPTEIRSAHAGLYYTFLNILKMSAPFVPHLTEEMYHAEAIKLDQGKGVHLLVSTDKGYFRTNEGKESIHISPWPRSEVLDTSILKAGEMIKTIANEVRRHRTTLRIKHSEPIPSIVVSADKQNKELLDGFILDLTSFANTPSFSIVDSTDSIPPDALHIRL